MAKIVFYSAQTGKNGFIQSIKEQQIPEFEYWFLHDNHHEAISNKGWNYIDISDFLLEKSNPKRNRFIKMMPNYFFKDCEYTIWIDCKFYLPKKFFEDCYRIINEDKPDFMCCRNPIRTTLEQELSHMKTKRNFTDLEVSYAKSFIDTNIWFSTDLCWLIRKNNETNNEIGKKWFDLTDKCYPDYLGQVRDQLTFPTVIKNKDYLNMKYSVDELYKFVNHQREKQYI